MVVPVAWVQSHRSAVTNVIALVTQQICDGSVVHVVNMAGDNFALDTDDSVFYTPNYSCLT